MARPSKYDEAACLEVLEALGNDGEGMAEAIVMLGISRDTFYRWQDEYAAFSDAVKQMRMRSQAWWEQKGRAATFGATPGFNATAYVFNMKNRFPDDWRDRQELTGADGGPIAIEGVEVTFVRPQVRPTDG